MKSAIELSTQISRNTKFQMNQTVLIVWTKLARKDYCESKTEKGNGTIEFTIFELEII